MFADPFAATIDHFGTAQDTQAQTRHNAGLLFDELYGQARRAAMWARLTGRTPALRPLTHEPAPGPRATQTVSVALDEIVGSEDRAGDFDAAFRPLRRNTRDRWISVAAARRQGVALPPVELVRGVDGYYVRDGHHRISVAKAAGQMAIEARIVSG